MKYTISDVAREAGVSITTVSRVINGNYPVKIETRERVEAAIKKFDFTPNPLAKGLINKKTNTIAMLVPNITNLFFTEVVCGVEMYSSLYEYDVILSETNSSPKVERKKIEKLINKLVDGIIIVGPQNENIKSGFIEEISKQIPMVCINGYSKHTEINYVLSDEDRGAREAFDYLFNLGHRGIGFIRGGESYSYDVKENVYREYMKGANQRELIIDIEDSNTIEVIEYTANRIVELKKENTDFLKGITALFACNDLMAVGALNGIEKIGLKVPEDISIIGYDNTSFSQVVTPKITTIDLNMKKLGGSAADILFNIINGSEKRKKVIEVLPTKLVVRNSCKKII